MKKTGLLDVHGFELIEGDYVGVPYITPLGELTTEIDFKAQIVFYMGCYGYWHERRFTPLMDWCKRGKKEYVANVGEIYELLPQTYLTGIINAQSKTTT